MEDCVINEMLDELIQQGICTYEAVPNGCGTVNTFTFKNKEDIPSSIPQGDLFSQYQYIHKDSTEDLDSLPE